MFEALGYQIFRWRRWVLALAGVFVAVALTWGTGVFGVLADGGFDDPDSDSARAEQLIAQTVDGPRPDVVAIYRSPSGDVDDPALRTAVETVLAGLPRDQVVGVATYWQTQLPAMVSVDRHSTYAVLELAGADAPARAESYQAVHDQLAASGLELQVAGSSAIFDEINTTIQEDIARAETLSMPILLVLLVVIFGSLAAASLPLAIGAIAVLGAFTMLRLLTEVTDISVFSINIVTILGLGLAIDYALFMVSRFREELPRHATVADALARTMATAGRTVVFSGITVAVSLAALLMFPLMFLRSMGYGGIAAVLVAMVAALTVLPALLAVLGHRVDALRFRLPGWLRLRLRLRRGRAAHGATATAAVEHGAWYRLAHSVMRRPVAYIAVIGVLLVAFGAPFLSARWGGVDARMLPEGASSRIASTTLEQDFPVNATTPIDVVVAGDQAGLPGYLDAVRAVPGVSSAEVIGQRGDTSVLAVGYADHWGSQEAQNLVKDIRALSDPAGAEVYVGGSTAQIIDQLGGIGRMLPWAALVAVAATLVLLFLAFGSVVLPVKAVVMNTLSLAASFGVVVWIFQEGHLSDLLGFTATGTLAPGNLVLMLAILFGLSMDYEVFLLSRIREQWDATGDNTTAVATGLQRSGRIITGAALLLVVVIGAFSTSSVAMIKMIGVGMAVAIILDATVIRALLVPATMRLLGRANWWAPAPLAAFWRRHGIREETGPGAGPTLGPATPAPTLDPATPEPAKALV
ncbi:MAG: MMPL family transporter [Sporichthyaceae bacterium]|nr:MMPL family transporter [Sporichthyaceae bacterium]